MTTVNAGRGFAVLISATTFVFLFVNGSWRDGNLFLVPDLIICTLLLAAAALPRPYAAPSIAFGLAMSTGVFTASVASYAVRGELGFASLLGVVGCAAMAAVLLDPRQRTRLTRDSSQTGSGGS